MSRVPSLQQRVDRELLRLTLIGSGLAATLLALMVAVLQTGAALQEAQVDAQAVERDLLEQLTTGLPLTQIQRKLQISAAANQLTLAAVVNQRGKIIAASDSALVGQRFSRKLLEPISNASWDAVWPCLPAARSWWQHPRCQPPLSRTTGPIPWMGGDRLISLARTPLTFAGVAGREEGGLLITSMDLGPNLEHAAINGGLIVLAGLVLLVASGGGLVLVVRARLMRQLVRLARVDSCTGLLNRDAFLESVSQWLAQHHSESTTVVLAICGVDHFKEFNARHGYLAGDRLLAALAASLGEVVREGEWLARLSGDQFGLALLGGSEQGDRLRALCARQAKAPVAVEEGHTARITISIGMACSSGPAGWGLNALLAQADRNLREAKLQGGNQVLNQ